MEILNSKKGLDLVDNDKELYEVLIDTFLNESEFDSEKLKQMIAENKMLEAAGYVHAIKGAGRQIGTEILAESCQKLEDILRGKKSGNIEGLIKEILENYKTTFEAVKNFSF